MNEMNVQSIDLGHELWQGVQSCLDLAPVIICRPVTCQRLHEGELHALRPICNRLSFRPLCRLDALAQLGKFRFGNTHPEGADCSRCGLWRFELSAGASHLVS